MILDIDKICNVKITKFWVYNGKTHHVSLS